MNYRAGQNKNMPDGMGIPHFFVGIKDGANGVGHASRGDQAQFRSIQGLHQGFDKKKGQPSHGQVQDQGQLGESMGIKYFKYRTEEGKGPNDSQIDPSLPSPHGDKQKRRIGPGYQEVNTDMVKNPQKGFNDWGLNGMVKGRESIKQQDGCPEQATADHMDSGPIQY